jgi:hypothetical protein
LEGLDRPLRIVEMLLQNLAESEPQIGRGKSILAGQGELPLDDLGEILPLFGGLIESA